MIPPMHPRAAQLIDALQLAPHPEGGHFREIFRSTTMVQPGDGRPPRSAMTAIHFLLASGHASRWHVVTSDEQWTLLEGDPLELLIIDPGDGGLRAVRLGRGEGGAVPISVPQSDAPFPSADQRTHTTATAIVPAGHWQAARPTGAYSLVTCTVGPGFDFDDFTLIADDAVAAARLRREHPTLAELL